MIAGDQLKVLQRAADVARGLALDMVATSKSGHLGLPLGCAEIGAALFGYLLRLSPGNPRWANRDRFILSAGHGSAFLYTWLSLLGFDVGPLSGFRVKGSKLPGHPEFGITPGVECTTGPLGQGVGNAVGFAISEKMQQARLGNPEALDYRIICLCGDGCLQEGISHEACSLAGHLKLDNLTLIYDANGITLDAPLERSQTEDLSKRFGAYGFFVQAIDGHDIGAITEAYEKTKRVKQPSLIIARTTIGKGLPEIEGTSKAHGESGAKWIREAKQQLGLPEDAFLIPEEVRLFFAERRHQLEGNFKNWEKKYGSLFKDSINIFPGELNQQGSEKALTKESPVFDNEDLQRQFASKIEGKTVLSTRVAGKIALNLLAEQDDSMITGSADLFSSAKNYLHGLGDFSAQNPEGRNLWFGIREHAMGAILNGIAYDGIFRPSGSTFLVFSDYLRPAIRVAALAKLPVVYIFTHDSIAVGQDGPTHQPVETVAALRAIPNLEVIRPADAWECLAAYRRAFERKDGPTALILSRQDLPILEESQRNFSSVQLGAYIIQRESGTLKLIILATGSEVSLALAAARAFRDTVRVVSMPSMECFEEQSEAYKNSILPESCENRLAVEAGISQPWYRYIGLKGTVISVEHFGFSAPGKEVQEAFGLTEDAVKKAIKKQLT